MMPTAITLMRKFNLNMTTVSSSPKAWYLREEWNHPDGIMFCAADNTLYFLQPLSVWYVGKLPDTYNNPQLELAL